MVCSHCNLEVDDSREYCPHCGRKMSGKMRVGPAKEEENNQFRSPERSREKLAQPVHRVKRTNYVKWVLAVLILALAAKGLYSLVRPAPLVSLTENTAPIEEESGDAVPESTGISDSSEPTHAPESASAPAPEEDPDATGRSEAEGTLEAKKSVNNESKNYDTITAYNSVGDLVYYGAYEQDNDLENGDEPIEWIVLDVKDDRYLLIASEIIDEVCYNSVWERTAWENCSLRTWLNETFLEEAFSEKQQRRIVRTRHTNEDGYSTNDQIFILNGKELRKYFTSMESRAAGATPYAEAKGVYEYKNGNCWWWVRDAGQDPHYAVYVNCIGDILEYGILVFNNAFGVRPAIWVNK